MAADVILDDVARYYTDKLQRFGATPAGVDWRDEDSQHTRFEQLLGVVEDPDGSVVDFGCGFGSLLPHMRKRGFTGNYLGLDIAPDMIAAATTLHHADPLASFEVGSQPSTAAHYAVASGIFNVRMKHGDAEWKNYIAETIQALDRAGSRGFSFNCLTSYSDLDRMRDYLFYADPCFYFDLCKRNYSRQVALLHDYGLYEFTVIVRKS
jgi:SAM-dependent methyltransferase